MSAQARAVMVPMLTGQSTPEMMMTLLRNPLTRAAVRLAAKAPIRPIAKARAKRWNVSVARGKVSGVPVRYIRRRDGKTLDQRLLLNFHGGGFAVDAGSLTETIPIAGTTGIPVNAVMYRLAPEHPYPAAVDDALAVYRHALTGRDARSIGVFGTSAGAVLTLQLLARLKAEGLPMPAAAGVFSGAADLSRAGDCEAFLPPIMGDRASPEVVNEYCGTVPRADPLLSPAFGDLSGLPPVLLMTSTRDQLLSHTVLADLALRNAGVDVDLRVYEGMAHAFWAWIECPESESALAAQAAFFARHVTA